MPRAPRRHRVVALLYDELCTFEFGIVVELFGLARPEFDFPWYDFSTCSLERRPLKATGAVRVSADRGLEALKTADTIVLPGWRDADEVPPKALLDAVRKAHARGARIVALCSGAFILAAAGLLDGKRAATHWRYAERLSARYPRIRVEPDVLYVDEGSLLTSAGSAAGIDLCLHVIRNDHGAKVANMVARRLVLPPHRDGGQAQYIPEPMPARDAGGLAPLLAWAQARLDQPLSLEDLAKQGNMSLRTLARRFAQETGTTPHKWLTHQRLLAAQRRLEMTTDPIDRVAEGVGFESGMTLRHHFRRTFGTSPTAYRRRFALQRQA
ncbi:MAG TPA: transcriptional regulator FtrA [Gemmatimonadales bacterium]|nr:transcriptional regulator FtrA [Gemmatimonadales bacterium]